MEEDSSLLFHISRKPYQWSNYAVGREDSSPQEFVSPLETSGNTLKKEKRRTCRTCRTTRTRFLFFCTAFLGCGKLSLPIVLSHASLPPLCLIIFSWFFFSSLSLSFLFFFCGCVNVIRWFSSSPQQLKTLLVSQLVTHSSSNSNLVRCILMTLGSWAEADRPEPKRPSN